MMMMMMMMTTMSYKHKQATGLHFRLTFTADCVYAKTCKKTEHCASTCEMAGDFAATGLTEQSHRGDY